MSLSQRGNPKNIRVTVKALVREKKHFRMRQVCAGASNLPPDAIKVHKCTLHIYTQTHSYHISQSEREREREEGEREMQSEERFGEEGSVRPSSVTSALKPARRAPASHVWFVYQKTSRRSKKLFTQLPFIIYSFFKVGRAPLSVSSMRAACMWGQKPSTSSHIIILDPESMWTCAHLVHLPTFCFPFQLKSSLTWFSGKGNTPEVILTVRVHSHADWILSWLKQISFLISKYFEVAVFLFSVLTPKFNIRSKRAASLLFHWQQTLV